jgi:hypothetical protein
MNEVSIISGIAAAESRAIFANARGRGHDLLRTPRGGLP